MIIRKVPPDTIIEYETFEEFVLFKPEHPSRFIWQLTIRNCVFHEGFQVYECRYCTFEGNISH